MRKKVIIFGVGFLGRKLVKFFANKFEVLGADIQFRELLVRKVDATNIKEIEDFFTIEKPDIVIDTIALSSYFICESNYELCRRLNFETAVNIAKSCKKINAKMIFISSSYVFDGKKGNYLESDIPNASNKYAISKINAENEVLKIQDSIIIRSEVMYGFDEKRKQIVIGTNTFEDSFDIGYPGLLRKPVFIDDLPIVIHKLIEKKQSGVFNVAGSNKIKWLDFVLTLSRLANAEDKVKIVNNADWVLTPPFDTSLNTSKIQSINIKVTSFNTTLRKIEKISNLYRNKL